MATADDKLAAFDPILSEWKSSDSKPFWDSNNLPQLEYGKLLSLLEVPVRDGDKTQSGRFAKAVDLWIACELERAGFSEECVWPRASSPRVLDPEVSGAISALSRRFGVSQSALNRKFGCADAYVMGSVYKKQVDVGMSNWLTGPELLISTKTMGSSFGKNMANRFEEAYGDVKNLRERYPLAAHGFFFLVESSICEEPNSLNKAIHMLRQLSRDGDVYDAVCLMPVSWSCYDCELDSKGMEFKPEITIPDEMRDVIPGELSCEHFFTVLIDKVLECSSIDSHQGARALRQTR